MGTNTRKYSADSVISRVETALENYQPKRGIPTWKAVGIAADDMAEYVAEVPDLAAVVDEWSARTGKLATMPGSLLSDAIMSAIIAADDVETMTSLKAAWRTVKAGQAASSGDALTDIATTAGDKVGRLIAEYEAALMVLRSAVPSQVVKAGPERVAAYVAARDAEHVASSERVEKLIGSPINGNSTLAQTYGSDVEWSVPE